MNTTEHVTVTQNKCKCQGNLLKFVLSGEMKIPRAFAFFSYALENSHGDMNETSSQKIMIQHNS